MRLSVAFPVRLAVTLYCLFAFGVEAAQAQTLAEINKVNGLHESLETVRPGIARGIKSLPVPTPEKYKQASTEALEDSFDADKMELAVETLMAGKLTDKDLSDLASFYASPLGKHVTALEIGAASAQASEIKRVEGPRILAEIQAKDPERLDLYKKIMADISAVDMTEATALNMAYAMTVGMLSAAGKTFNDEQVMAVVRQNTAGLRDKIEKSILEGNAYTYRDLSIEDLRLYSVFLSSPAGHRYYDQMLTAMNTVLTNEARSFGQKLQVNLGLRKA